MSRYIDADELKDFIFRWGDHSTVDDCIQWIEQTETADVRENVRGEWLPHPNKQNKEWDVCSACGIGCKRREYGIHANGEKWVTEYNFPFCPNCGAEMGGDNNV